MKLSSKIASYFAASMLLTSLAMAVPQVVPCPASAGNPLNGTNWAFHWESSDFFQFDSAAIGTFSINQVADTRGGGTTLVLTGIMTINAQDQVSRLASTNGKVQYQCDDTGIRGGNLQLNDGQNPSVWEFVFASSAQNEMYLVNQYYYGGAAFSKVLKGSAVRIDGQQPCPANPMTALDNALAPATLGWSFRTSTVFSGTVGTSAIGIINGRLASAADRTGLGAITGTITTNTSAGLIGFSVSRLADIFGRYQVYGPTAGGGSGAGCAGGTLSFLVGPYAAQYEYVFADGAHSQLFLLSTNATSNGGQFTSRPTNGRYSSDMLIGFMRKY